MAPKVVPSVEQFLAHVCEVLIKSIRNWLLLINSPLWIANLNILYGTTHDPCSRDPGLRPVMVLWMIILPSYGTLIIWCSSLSKCKLDLPLEFVWKLPLQCKEESEYPCSVTKLLKWIELSGDEEDACKLHVISMTLCGVTLWFTWFYL